MKKILLIGMVMVFMVTGCATSLKLLDTLNESIDESKAEQLGEPIWQDGVVKVRYKIGEWKSSCNPLNSYERALYAAELALMKKGFRVQEKSSLWKSCVDEPFRIIAEPKKDELSRIFAEKNGIKVKENIPAKKHEKVFVDLFLVPIPYSCANLVEMEIRVVTPGKFENKKDGLEIAQEITKHLGKGGEYHSNTNGVIWPPKHYLKSF